MSLQNDDVAVVLLHSPLVPHTTVMPLATALRELGLETVTPRLTNHRPANRSFHQHHIDEIHRSLAMYPKSAYVLVAHSGAGTLSGCTDVAASLAYVMLDAIFPVSLHSRFALFDDSSVADLWRSVAQDHAGHLPAARIADFGKQISDPDQRAILLEGVRNVPIALYEEIVRVLPDWSGEVPGLYMQWTQAYRYDAERAELAGFRITRRPASHFELINNPTGVASCIVDFLESIT